jgi:hypothetical protein
MRNLLKITAALAAIFLVIGLFNLGYNEANVNETVSPNIKRYDLCTVDIEIKDSILVDTNKYVYQEIDTSTVIVNSYYTEMILNQFVKDASMHGLDSSKVMDHIKTLDAILVADLLEDSNLGITIYKPDSLSPTGLRGVILIEQKLLTDVDLYGLTLYHELGHWFGLEHCDCDDNIMMDKYDRQDTYKVLGDWQKNVKKMMKKIKKKYNKKEDHFSFPEIPDSIKVTEFGYEHSCNYSH